MYTCMLNINSNRVLFVFFYNTFIVLHGHIPKIKGILHVEFCVRTVYM